MFLFLERCARLSTRQRLNKKWRHATIDTRTREKKLTEENGAPQNLQRLIIVHEMSSPHIPDMINLFTTI